MNPVDDAIAIWKAGVAAVEPQRLINDAVQRLTPELRREIETAPRILVVGAGKAGAAMALGLEEALTDLTDNITGLVNVPEGSRGQCKKIELHLARPSGSNFPTVSGVAGSERMLSLMDGAGPDDVAFCLLSGGGSALLPAPAFGISLDDKNTVTKQFHACGAYIGEMNAVRKHISRIKGGLLAKAFRGKRLHSLIISDVVGDPVDVIASGPTVADTSTFAEAMDAIVDRGLLESCPPRVLQHLDAGLRGELPETPKVDPPYVLSALIGSNHVAREAARLSAVALCERVIVLDQELDGELPACVLTVAAVVRRTVSRPTVILFGGETTVALGPNPGKGGRNQEFVLAMLCELGLDGMKGVTILSGGTDGEDGPTDAAGAIGTEVTLRRAQTLNLNPHDFLARHDSYHFFDATGGLFKTGLTGTNVMDLGVILLN